MVFATREEDDMSSKIPEQCLDPDCGSKKITLLEYAYDQPEHYDGVSEIICRVCGKRFGRWTKKELKNGEVEKRYGGPPTENPPP